MPSQPQLPVLGDVRISSATLKKRIAELAKQIQKDYQSESIRMIVVLKGASMFADNLASSVLSDVEMDYLEVSSYKGRHSTGHVQIQGETVRDLHGADVLLVEDIVDSGLTLEAVLKYLRLSGPKSIKVASLLSKPTCRVAAVHIDYLGFEIPDIFVVGYGMDFGNRFRDLPDIHMMKDSDLQDENASGLRVDYPSSNTQVQGR